MAPEDTILTAVENLQFVNFTLIGQIVGLMLTVMWVFTVIWVWHDSGERTASLPFRVIMSLFVLPFNVPGLVIYLMIRPTQTIEQVYWSELERKYLVYETAELDDCTNCGHQLMPGFNNCPQCAHEVRIECSGCGVMIDTDFKYCPHCKKQHRQRAAKVEEMTQESMAESSEELMQDVVEAVEKKGVRYVRRGGLAGIIMAKAKVRYKDGKKKRAASSARRKEEKAVRDAAKAAKKKVKKKASKPKKNVKKKVVKKAKTKKKAKKKSKK